MNDQINNNEQNNEKKSKQSKVATIFYYIGMTIFILATLCYFIGAFTQKADAATLVFEPCCQECGSTNGRIIGYEDAKPNHNGAGEHYVLFSCNNCSTTTRGIESCQSWTSSYTETNGMGSVTHTKAYTCEKCKRVHTVVEGHTTKYCEYTDVGFGNHKVVRVCWCDTKYDEYQEEHDFYHTVYEYVNDLGHIKLTSCICGSYTSEDAEHTYNMIGLTAITDNYHTVKYYCPICDTEFTKDEEHIREKYTKPCTICEHKNSEDFKHDINYSTSEQKNTGFSALVNDSYDIDEYIKVGSDGKLNINGWLAINGGVASYKVQILTDDGTTETIIPTNKDAGRALSSTIISNINGSTLIISDYDRNAHYNITVDLTKYYGKNFIVALTATSYNQQGIVLAVFSNIDYGRPQGDIGTDFPIFPPIEDETETPSGTNKPDSDITEDFKNWQEAYNAGYQKGLLDMQTGIFGDITVNVYYTYRDSQSQYDLPITDKVILNLATATNGLSFKPIYEYYLKSIYNSERYSLIQVDVEMWFPGAFQFTNNLIYFSGGTSLTLDDMPIDLTIYTLDDLQLDVDVYLTKKGYQFYWTVNDLTGYNLVEAVRFRITNTHISFEELFVNQSFAINSNHITYTSNVSSYEQGKADGYDKGYELGEIVGQQKYDKDFYEQRYREGRADGYESGKEAGKLIGRNEAVSEKLNWYSMILAIPDAHVQTIQGLFNFTLFGVNMLNFVLSMVTLLLLWRLKKFII